MSTRASAMTSPVIGIDAAMVSHRRKVTTSVLNDVLRDGRKRRKGLRVKAPKLNETLFPNGLTWSTGHSTKAVAYIVHMNWVKQSKKARLIGDGLWFLTSDDTRCAAGFDPREPPVGHSSENGSTLTRRRRRWGNGVSRSVREGSYWKP